MSHTTIYRIDKQGDVIEYSEIKNAHRIYILIWTVMFDLYNDLFIDKVEKPEWMPKNHVMSFSDLQISGDMKPFWDIFHDEEMFIEHRIVFGSTFDRVIIMKENFDELIKSYENFAKHMTSKMFKKFFEGYDFTGLQEFAAIVKELKKDKDCIGVAICSSLISSFWDNYSEEGEYTPYNIFKNKNHSNLFADLKPKNNELPKKKKASRKSK